MASIEKLPLSLEQITAFLSHVSSATLKISIAIRPDFFPKSLRTPQNAYLHLDTKLTTNERLSVDQINIAVVDAFDNPLASHCPLFALQPLQLKNNDSALLSRPNAHLVAFRCALCFGTRRNLDKTLLFPLRLPELLDKLARGAKPVQDTRYPHTPSPIATTVPADLKSAFYAKDVKFLLRCCMTEGSTFELNEGTRVKLCRGGDARMAIKGVRDYTTVTITGTGLRLETPILSTGSSDLDIRVTLNRKPGGMHHLALNPSTLRNVRFNTQGADVPPIQSLRIVAHNYDFVITINPHDSFTLEDLIAKITERVGDPMLVQKLRSKLLGKAMDATADSTAPSEIVIDSARWNVVDYVIHDFRGVYATIKDLPHIRQDLDDPAIQKIAREGTLHLQLFLVSTKLQLASMHDPVKLREFVELALSPSIFIQLRQGKRALLRQLLALMGLSAAESRAFQKRPAKSGVREASLKEIERGQDRDMAQKVETLLHALGNYLNARERTWLRVAWTDAGGLESEGRAYALLTNLIEVTVQEIAADSNAPPLMKALLQDLPLGDDLDQRMTVVSDGIRGAIWAANGVLRDGWLAVSRNLESSLRLIFGEDIVGKGVDVFRESARKQGEEPFTAGNVRFLTNGEEFLQQIMRLMDETERAFGGAESDIKAVIMLNYWAFEAIEANEGSGELANEWGLLIAKRLQDLAMKGFAVSVIVDEKNGPSRRGQAVLRSFAANVQEKGRGIFHLLPWIPDKEAFPTGNHVKYFCTPLGVIAGGSNLGDHYAHWSDTNFLLRGADAVNIFVGHHFAILEEQRSTHDHIPRLPTVRPSNDNAWRPLALYQHNGESSPVFQLDWENIEFRVFRDHGGDEKDRILVECIAALDSARGLPSPKESGTPPPQTVYIANCYFVVTQPISDHPLSRALQRALERGVNVEIISNTRDSIDVPVTAAPNVKSMYLILTLARKLSKAAAVEGRTTGRVTLHLPDENFIAKTKEGIPEVLIHDKILFVGELALVKTTNLHPRSFTLEQEILTEMIGSYRPPIGEEYEKFLARACKFVGELKKSPGGSRIEDVDTLLAPVKWVGNIQPSLWGPSATLYLLYLEKRFRYCKTFSSDSDEDVKIVESRLDESIGASITDLFMNIF